MIKYIQYDGMDKHGSDRIIPVNNSYLMNKIAHEINPELDKYLRELGAAPENKMRVIVRAVSAHEAWDDNVNGDSFKEEDLTRVMKYVDMGNRDIRVLDLHESAPMFGKVYEIPMYRTFDIFGSFYKEHRNNLGDPTYGDVRRAFYNPIQKRVEIVIDVDREKGEDICRSYEEKREPRKVSMGFKCVPGDICSICGNMAPTRAEYCDHLKFQLREILDDGRLVSAINDKGFFFDISDVFNPADKTALYLFKAASENPERVIGSAEVAEQLGAKDPSPKVDKDACFLVNEKGESLKEADIDKVVDVYVDVEKVASSGENEIYNASKVLFDRPDMSVEQLKSIYKTAGSLDSALSTMYAAGIFPTKQDFQDLALMKMGHEDLIEQYRNHGMLFEIKEASDERVVLDFNKVSHSLLESIVTNDQLMTERSFHKPWQAKRMAHMLNKEASTKKADKFDALDQIDDLLIPNPDKYKFHNNKVVVEHQNNTNIPPIAPQDTSVKEFNPLTPLAIIGGMYAGIRALRNTEQGGFGKMMDQNKYTKALLPIILGAAYLGSKGIQEVGVGKKEASAKDVLVKAYPKIREFANDNFLNLLGATAIGWGMGGRAENKRLSGIQPNNVEEFYEQNPIIGTLGTFAVTKGLANKLPKGIKLSTVANAILLDDENINDFSPETLDAFVYEGARLINA